MSPILFIENIIHLSLACPNYCCAPFRSLTSLEYGYSLEYAEYSYSKEYSEHEEFLEYTYSKKYVGYVEYSYYLEYECGRVDP